jgi:divalent metal cation (Fe/Co/Zn/Cd) transporter
MRYLKESKDPTAKTVIFEDSAALLGIVIAANGLFLTEHQVPLGQGAYWNGVALIVIGLILAIVAFVLARSSRGLLLGEAANSKEVEAIRLAIKHHPNVVETVELLTMHLAPKQILVSARVNLKNELTSEEIVRIIGEIEQKMKEVETKVDMIFLETSSLQESTVKGPIPENIG